MSEKKKNKTICHFDEDDENFLLVIIQQYYTLNKISTTVISFVGGGKNSKGVTPGGHFPFGLNSVNVLFITYK